MSIKESYGIAEGRKRDVSYGKTKKRNAKRGGIKIYRKLN